ncbi:ParB/RepB/Spo0J family partition protein [Nocardia carnea]|uniref:ParB/RepB/Spo0J family partition protein n=1 Tax=Nocardia carnea TaxID=37328 RepID=UPI0002FBF9F7|nr:hypothetical protein [Nocardia carnea]
MTTTEITTPQDITTAEVGPTSEAQHHNPAPETTVEEPTINGTPLSEVLAMIDASPTGKISFDVDPREVVFGDNMRSEVTLTKAFIDGIRDGGFVQDPPAYINDDGQVQMIAGQSRMLAAIEAGYIPCPVILRRKPHDDATTLAAEVMTAQWRENEHRTQTSARDKVVHVENFLNLPGFTPTKVGQKLGVDAAEVRAIKALRQSEDARKKAETGQLTFTQAATLMEFEGDEQTETRLLKAAGRNNFDAEAAKIRAEREETAGREAASEPYRQRGFTILDREIRDWSHEARTTCPLGKLYGRQDGHRATEDDIKTPARWAVYLERSEVEATDGDLDEYWTPLYYCTDPKAEGLQFSQYGHDVLTDKDREQKRTDNAIVKAGNRYARAATTARRKFETELLAKLTGKGRKRPAKIPTGLLSWAAQVMFTRRGLTAENTVTAITADLLGVDRDAAMSTGALFEDMTDPRAAAMLIGLAIGAVEASMQRRSNDPTKKENPTYWRAALHQSSSVHYPADTVSVPRSLLAALQSAGYTPTPIERAILGEMTRAEAFEAEAAAEVAAEGTVSATPTTTTPAKAAPTKAAKAAPTKTTRARKSAQARKTGPATRKTKASAVKVTVTEHQPTPAEPTPDQTDPAPTDHDQAEPDTAPLAA